MDWLRCNRCCEEMKKSSKTFSLTQCGHLYCSRCLAAVKAKCTMCGTQNFKTMPLTNPPKSEMLNFFTPVDEFIDTANKIEMFQDNQLDAVSRSFEKREKKYENLKKMYWTRMKEMKLLSQYYQKLNAETDKLEAIRIHLLKAREVKTVNTDSSRSSALRYPQQHQNQRTGANFQTPIKLENGQDSSFFSRQSELQRDTRKYTLFNNFPGKNMLPSPQYLYDPSTPHSSRGNDSDGYVTGSDLSSIPGSSSSRNGVFRVPSAQKVPKSVATLRKRTPPYQQ